MWWRVSLVVLVLGGCQSKGPEVSASDSPSSTKASTLTPLQVKNQETLLALAKAGDDPTKVRVVDHRAYFSSEAAAKEYIEAAEKLGGVSIIRTNHGAHAVKSQIKQTTDATTVDRISGELNAAAVAAGGEYDSWGSPVMSKSNKNQSGKVDPEQKIRDDIRSSGFSMMSVMEDGDGPGFTYSIGIHQTIKAPEVVVIGPSPDLAQHLVQAYYLRVRDGEEFESNKEYSDFLTKFKVRFEAVHNGHYEDYFGRAIDHYGGQEFPVLQMILPSTSGVWPWDANASEEFKSGQPVLSRMPVK